MFKWSSQTPPVPDPVHGQIAELEEFLMMLQRSESDDSFLVIEIEDSGDFLQLLATPELFRLDFPLITGRQRTLELRVRQIAADAGLRVTNTEASDGPSVLDIDIPRDAHEAAIIVRRFLEGLYAVDSDTALRFVCNEC
jgi:hypothetical protein